MAFFVGIDRVEFEAVENDACERVVAAGSGMRPKFDDDVLACCRFEFDVGARRVGVVRDSARWAATP